MSAAKIIINGEAVEFPGGAGGSAENVSFDPGETGMSAKNVQEAIEELLALIQAQAESVVPKEYTRLEYIETTGAQYIDMGIYGQDGLSASLTVEFSSVSSQASIFSVFDGAAGKKGVTGLIHSPAPNTIQGWEVCGSSIWATGAGLIAKTNWKINIQRQGRQYAERILSGAAECGRRSWIIRHNNRGILSKHGICRFYSGADISTRWYVYIKFFAAWRNA